MSDKEERKISLEKRKEMLKNLEKARATRAKNLAQKKENVVIESEKKEPKEPVDEDIAEQTADSKAKPKPIKHECLCGRKYTRKDGLFKHQQKCEIWLEERAEDADIEEEVAEIKAEREAEEAKEADKENVVIKPKRKKNVKLVVDKEPLPEPVEPKPIPEPAPPTKKNIVPSAEPKYHNGQEPAQKFTMAEWKALHEKQQSDRYNAESRRKFEQQEARINRLKQGMMSGGI
jgi:hypothetical protein